MAQGKSNSIYSLIAMLAALAAVVIIILIYAKLPQQPDDDIVASAKKLAGELTDNNLPDAAIDEYRKILDKAILTDSERGAINYLIGKLYFEEIAGYEQAASYYIRARSLDDKASYYNEAGKNLITCLERMGRRLDARRELDVQAGLQSDTASGKIVAIVGSSHITLSDFNMALESLPPEIRQQFSTIEGKKEFLNQMIGRELIYHAALREGFDKENEVQKAIHEIEKEYMVQYYSGKKIAPTVKPDTSDLRIYFQANKQKYGDKEFEEINQDVAQDYINYLSQKAMNEYIGTLLQAEPVQKFEENLK